MHSPTLSRLLRLGNKLFLLKNTIANISLNGREKARKPLIFKDFRAFMVIAT